MHYSDIYTERKKKPTNPQNLSVRTGSARSKIPMAVTSRPISNFTTLCPQLQPPVTQSLNRPGLDSVDIGQQERRTLSSPGTHRQQITERWLFSSASSPAPDATDVYRIIRAAKLLSLVFAASSDIQTAWSTLNPYTAYVENRVSS